MKNQTIEKELVKDTRPYAQFMEKLLTEPGKVSSCYSLFHDYSLNNSMWIYLQCYIKGIQPGPVGTFKKWQSLDRQVNKGEKGLTILNPKYQSFPIIDEKTKERKAWGKKLIGFYETHKHFVYSQTNGTRDIEKELNSFVLDFNKILECYDIKKVDYTSINGNSQGYAQTGARVLAINPVAEKPCKTMIHEIAHILLNHFERDIPRNIKEAEADSVAFIVLNMINSKDDYSNIRGYVQGWLKDDTLSQESYAKIFSVADKILKPKKQDD